LIHGLETAERRFGIRLRGQSRMRKISERQLAIVQRNQDHAIARKGGAVENGIRCGAVGLKPDHHRDTKKSAPPRFNHWPSAIYAPLTMGQGAPNCVASRTPCQLAGGWVGRQRSVPTGVDML
jgi:hypothetical protein